MKRIVILIGLLFMVQVLFAGFASASYNSTYDQSVNINAPVALPTTKTASFTFNLQQGIHQTISNSTGISINYFYIWVNVNGEPAAAVDPAIVMF
jgi:hypothetical protein